MAIYATVRKIEETDEYVIYVCGDSPDRLYHKFMIVKEKFNLSASVRDCVTPLSQNADFFLVMQVCSKIFKHYIEHGTFPDKATKQS